MGTPITDPEMVSPATWCWRGEVDPYTMQGLWYRVTMQGCGRQALWCQEDEGPQFPKENKVSLSE